MTDRRMVSKRIVESSRFLKLPDALQNLYFHLMLNADDDGVVEAFIVLRICGYTEDHLQKLVDANLVYVLSNVSENQSISPSSVERRMDLMNTYGLIAGSLPATYSWGSCLNQ